MFIVMTDDKTFASVSSVLEAIDRPKPQVLIKVVFLEVTHSKALDLGVEGTYNHQFDGAGLATNLMANLAGGVTTNIVNQNPVANLNNNFLLASQGTQPSQIGGNTMPAGAGIYSILGNDWTVTIRAISSAIKAEVLSRPSILVRNNQPAAITVGQSVPLVSSVTYSAVNNLPISTIAYRDVGIILQVTPFIKPDNSVEMIVAPQISSLSSQSVPISIGFNAPAIDLRSASTVVVVPDGQTVIIGGLVQNSKAVIDTKIPILGDIPLLGFAFRRTQQDHTKKELLIFLTPHVVQVPDNLASLTRSEIDKTELAPKAFTEKEYNQALDNLQMKKNEKEPAPAPGSSPTQTPTPTVK
jgi:general secretion pathway protein D